MKNNYRMTGTKMRKFEEIWQTSTTIIHAHYIQQSIECRIQFLFDFGDQIYLILNVLPSLKYLSQNMKN